MSDSIRLDSANTKTSRRTLSLNMFRPIVFLGNVPNTRAREKTTETQQGENRNE